MSSWNNRPTFDNNPRYKELAVKVGSDLRDLRMGFGFTQAQMIARARINNNTITDVENGKGPGIQLWTVWKYAHTLGYDVKITFVKRKKHGRSRPLDTEVMGREEAQDAEALPSGNQGGDALHGQGPEPHQEGGSGAGSPHR